MSEPAFITRDELTAPRHLVELMARTAYETGRPKGSGRPEWERTTPEWRKAMHREMAAALKAAQDAGYTLTMPQVSAK